MAYILDVDYTYKHSSPTFNINGVKGWDTRLIYSYYGYPKLIYNYSESGSAGGYTNNLFEGIEYFQEDSGKTFHSSSLAYKGEYQRYPAYYFKTGKTLRIKSNIYISSSVDDYTTLNVRTGIYNLTTSQYYTLGIQNYGYKNHETNRLLQASVDLEINLTSVGVFLSSSLTNKLYIQANGFYQYLNLDCFINPSNCNTASFSQHQYVPIGLNPIPPFENETGSFRYVGDITDLYKLTLDFSGSRTLNFLIPTKLTIEELG